MVGGDISSRWWRVEVHVVRVVTFNATKLASAYPGCWQPSYLIPPWLMVVYYQVPAFKILVQQVHFHRRAPRPPCHPPPHTPSPCVIPLTVAYSSPRTPRNKLCNSAKLTLLHGMQQTAHRTGGHDNGQLVYPAAPAMWLPAPSERPIQSQVTNTLLHHTAAAHCRSAAPCCHDASHPLSRTRFMSHSPHYAVTPGSSATRAPLHLATVRRHS